MNKTLYGVYETSPEVVQAVNSLKAKGYDSSDITIVADEANRLAAVDTAGTEVKTVTDDDSFMDKVKKFFSGDMGGNADHAFDDLGVTSVKRDEYARNIQDGKILVFVDGNRGILDGRETAATAEPALGVDRTNPVNTALNGGDRTPGDLEEEQKIRLREEKLQVEKDAVQTGEVVINKEVHSEPKEVKVPVEHDEVYVERRPVTDPTADTNAGIIADDDETIRIPVVEEQIEVTKKPVVTDEIVIGKEKVQETKTVHDNVKKEDVRVDKNGNPILTGDADEQTDLPLEKDPLNPLNDTDTTDPLLRNNVDTDKL
ncbi:YsnF/AvaK domain-containing protein [Bacillus testis]|uniref:YsnF/AvaK domain-containing protein n=1 Tax=Bacillus testis TaxID=1622072 RepID=UPI00067EB10B|nr:YsnF/AvaK domain-containing protein [Bacillus testis]